MSNIYSSVKKAISAFKEGQMIILTDDENRENEGDLCVAAEFASPEVINFMATHARGLICLAMSGTLIDKFHLPMMVDKNCSQYETPFTVSIEAATGVTTGISAHDRARTIQVAISSESRYGDLVSPGHVFPLRARDLGVIERTGHTEGSVDLAKEAKVIPAAVICEIMNPDGTMSRRDQLIEFAKKHNLLMVSISALRDYRVTHENLIDSQDTAPLPLREYQNFSITAFTSKLDKLEHFELFKEPLDPMLPPLVRIHSECITGDLFGSCRCDCGMQLKSALEQLNKEGGILIYLRQEGRGLGLINKIRSYGLQDTGIDTVEANLRLGLPIDNRDYGIAYQILRQRKLKSIRLITNNPLKIKTLEKYGIKIHERIPLITSPTKENTFYLNTKKEKLGHLF